MCLWRNRGFQLCRKYGVKNFVFSSSATVYGPPQHLPITEKDPVGHGITNPYGQTKYMIEQMLMDLSKAEKVRVCFGVTCRNC